MNNKTNKIETCEICGNQNLIPVLNLGHHPMCDDLISIGDARICREYPIEIVFCKNCITAHQRFQVPKQELFPASYHYRSRFTADVLSGMKELVASCEKKYGLLAGKKVLDIGCNDGSLLDFFKQRNAITFGIEPTAACGDAQAKGHLTYNDFLSKNIATEIVAKQGKPDLITFTNVFAHIENLQEVLAALKILMGPHTVIIIENHYLGSILDSNQFDTFYHEHPRSYSYTSFEHIARSLNTDLLDVEFPARYGGNIRVFLGTALSTQHKPTIDVKELRQKESHFLEIFAELQKKIACWKKVKQHFIQEYVQKNGKLRAKAFPGRAAILAKLLELNAEMISAVYEKPGSLKIGHYVPGTRIPIRSDEELFSLSDNTKPVLNLAWHIPKEIRTYLAENGYQGSIVDVLSPEDFSPSANDTRIL